MTDLAEHTLVFVSARWCQIANPMRVIFEELLRDLARNRPAAQVRGLEIDIDQADALMAEMLEDSAAKGLQAAARSSQPAGRSSQPAGGNPHEAGDRPQHQAAARAAQSSEAHDSDQDQLLDPVVTRELLESVDFIPMLILLRGSREIARFTGQLPKLRIRAELFDALDQSRTDGTDQAGGTALDHADKEAVE